MKSERDQIQELMACYANAIDAKDYDAISDCFAIGARAEYAGFTEPLEGPEAITAHVRRAVEPLAATQHMFGNFIIDIDADQARLTCDIIAQHVRQESGGTENFLAGGKYRVEARKQGGRWSFTLVSARTVWTDGNRNILPRSG